MKKITGILLVAALSVIMISCGTAKTTGMSKDEMAAFISKAVTEKDFRIDVNTAYALGNMQVLTSSYAVTVKGDSVYSYLPYYGVAYQATPYSGDPGLNFDGIMTGYGVGKGKGGTTIVQFILASQEDRYDYTIEIAGDGYTTLTVNAQNRQSIDFAGKLNTKTKEE